MYGEVFASTVNMDEKEWMELRKKGIGGSDAAAIAGLNPFKSTIEVYLEKIGKKSEQIDNEKTRIGRDLEDYVAKRFSEATSLKLKRSNVILKHPQYDWMLGNVDRLIVGKKEGLECKVTSSYAHRDWQDSIPLYHEIQCHHYMAVTGCEAWWLAVLIGNERFKYKRIDRDEDIIRNLITIEKRFWENYIIPKQMPAPDGSNAAKNLIKNMYPKTKIGTQLVLDEEKFMKKLNRRDEIMALLTKLEKEKNKIDQEIQLVMGATEKAYVGDRLIKWTTVHKTRFDSKAFKKDYPELYKKYVQQSAYRRFYIK